MEIWKDVLGYEGLYAVSSEGNIKSLERTVINKNGKEQKYPERFLKFDTNAASNSDYYRVTFSKDHKVKRYSVHRVVAEAFIPNPENKPHINHLDNDGTNNSITNLEWCTHSENMLHAQQQGRLFAAQSKGGKLGSAKEVEMAIEKSNSIVGQVFNQWEVLYPIGKLGKGKGKYYVHCKCLGCSREFPVEVGRLIRLEATSCKSCSRKR